MSLLEHEIEKKVILLKLLVKEEDESIEEALASLSDTKMATLQEIKRLFKELQDSGYITEVGKLSMMGVVEAQKAKQEFSI
jgi:predicted transcriptional regulator